MTAIATVNKPAPGAVSPLKEVEQGVAAMGTQLKSVLPSHIDPARFQRVAMTAIQADPELLRADRASLFTALTKAASDGLLPDRREGALTIANTKVRVDGREQVIPMVVWMPMVAGILKKIRQSGQVAKMIAKAVYERDEFEVLFGDDDRIYHKPYQAGHPGKIIGAYSIVHLKDGSISRDYMPWWRIERAKAAAKTKYVWDAWPDEMAIKTVIRHHAKLLPQSTDIEAVFERDDTLNMAAAMLSSPQAPPASQRLTGAALLAQASGDDGGGAIAITGQTLQPVEPAAAPSPTDGAGGAPADEAAPQPLAWTVAIISALMACQNREALAAVQHKKQIEIDKLAASDPDLHAQIVQAIQMKLAAFEADEGGAT